MELNFDIPHNITISDFFDILTKNNLQLISFNNNLPNPNITLTSNSNIDILKFIQTYQPQGYTLS